MTTNGLRDSIRPRSIGDLIMFPVRWIAFQAARPALERMDADIRDLRARADAGAGLVKELQEQKQRLIDLRFAIDDLMLQALTARHAPREEVEALRGAVDNIMLNALATQSAPREDVDALRGSVDERFVHVSHHFERHLADLDRKICAMGKPDAAREALVPMEKELKAIKFLLATK
jgi:hypothetical protein